VSRIRTGEALTAAGAIGLLVLLFLNWFSGGGVSASGWSSLGWALIALLVIVLVLAAITVGAALTAARPAVANGSAVLTFAVGLIALVVALIRVLIAQPALDMNLGNTAVSVQVAGYLGLVALALIAAGGWTTVADERTDAPQSAYTPPPPRPLPHA
jgi:amino acid transporter